LLTLVHTVFRSIENQAEQFILTFGHSYRASCDLPLTGARTTLVRANSKGERNDDGCTAKGQSTADERTAARGHHDPTGAIKYYEAVMTAFP
jgi:hypothetical protein